MAELSVVPTCVVAGKQPPIDFFSNGKWIEVPQTDPGAREILAIFNRAQAAADAASDQGKFSFWQESCNCKKRPPIYVFHSTPDGFLGMALDFDYVQQHYLGKLLKDGADSKASGKNGQLVISVLGENRKEIVVTGGRPAVYDVAVPFAPVFPRWQLAAGYNGATIAELARRNLKTNLLIDGITVTLLLAGILLTLRAAARQVQLAQAKSSFVANVSHELKTPLSLIRLFAEILEMGRATSKEKEREYHTIIHRESRRLTQLINNILDFSKIEAQRKQYQFTSCDVAWIVEDVLNTYEYQIASSGFELNAFIAPTLPTARVDQDDAPRRVLQQIVSPGTCRESSPTPSPARSRSSIRSRSSKPRQLRWWRDGLTVARASVNVDIFDAFDTFKQAHGVSDAVVHVFRIRIPPLRERREDIPLLVIATLSSRR